MLFSFLSPSELHGPIDHDVVVAAVSGFEPDGLVKKANDRSDHEMVDLGRVMIHAHQKPGVELVVVGQIGREASVGSLPKGVFNLAGKHHPRLIREEYASRLVVGQQRYPRGRLISAALTRAATAGPRENISLTIRQVPSFEERVELRAGDGEFVAANFIFRIKTESEVGVEGVVDRERVA